MDLQRRTGAKASWVDMSEELGHGKPSNASYLLKHYNRFMEPYRSELEPWLTARGYPVYKR